MDINGTLDGLQPVTRRCKIGTWLDQIDPTEPGRARLVTLLETDDPLDPAYRSAKSICRALLQLGLQTYHGTVGLHRTRECLCYRAEK